MTTISMQRDLVFVLKRETCLNIGILSKLKPIPADLTHQVFHENALEKPTQSFFNHLSYYLVSIVDHHVSASLPWPLYDTKTERAYRNELSNFISDYSSKGLLSPVMSSYLVNPGCYKVTMLMFQLSQLAVQRLLVSKMRKDRQKKLYDSMTETYKSNKKEGFFEDIERETELMLSKFSNYLCKKEAMEKIAAVFREKISTMEHALSSSNAQKIIDDIVDQFVIKNTLDDNTRSEILKIKSVSTPSMIFDEWLADVDEQISAIERKWDEKVNPFLESCQTVNCNTKALISRHMGEVDRHTYMIEYNPKTDEICTKELQQHVNSEQKYILKNIVRDEKLYFPNLVRGFLVAICFVLKNAEISDDIYKFNEYLDNGKGNFNEIASAMKMLLERVMTAEERLQPSPLSFNESLRTATPKQILEIPPIPDLSDIRSNKCLQNQIIFDTFTPLNTSKHQFNLLRRKNHSFTKPQPMSLLATPFHHGPRDDFLKSIISCRVSSYDRPNANHTFLNATMMSHADKANETIAECGTGFTKQQILRLLSTKKSSSSKKFKHSTERPDIKIKKGGLFNESNTSNESNGLFRSYSSPNLFENREKRSFGACRRRKLSIMQEDSPSLLEVSGIVALDKDSNQSTPQPSDSPRKLNTDNVPKIAITPDPEQAFNEMVKDVDIDFMKYAMKNESNDKEIKTETPKNNTQLIRKTSSLEKIINRFKKVRASVLPLEKSDDPGDFKTIVEEKENLNVVNVDVFTAHRILLPDLLSPSCSAHSVRSMDYLDHICYDIDEKAKKKPRESLGTALGVDQTFLDQFDLID